VDVLAGVNLNIAVAPGTSSGPDDAVAAFNLTLMPDMDYVAVASGVLDPSGFAANPEGTDIGFALFMPDEVQPGAAWNHVKLLPFHGVTDAPAVDITARRDRMKRRLLNNLAYGEFSPYRNVRADQYVLDLTAARNNSPVVASFSADLSGLGGGSAVVFASGFLDPAANGDGPALGLFAALPDGQVVEFPLVTKNSALTRGTSAEESLLPARFCLEQNYPNPFNPTTTISYTLPENGHVRLEIYNLLGQRVATLSDDWQVAGQRTVRWDASGLASGIYLCRLTAGGHTHTRKMTLLK
jgi:hypothetical protein